MNEFIAGLQKRPYRFSRELMWIKFMEEQNIRSPRQLLEMVLFSNEEAAKTLWKLFVDQPIYHFVPFEDAMHTHLFVLQGKSKGSKLEKSFYDLLMAHVADNPGDDQTMSLTNYLKACQSIREDRKM